MPDLPARDQAGHRPRMSAPRSAPDRTSGDRPPLRPAGPGHRRTGAVDVLVAFARASCVRPGRRPWGSAVATSPAGNSCGISCVFSCDFSCARLPASPASVQISPAARAWSGGWHPRCGRFAHISWLVWRRKGGAVRLRPGTGGALGLVARRPGPPRRGRRRVSGRGIEAGYPPRCQPRALRLGQRCFQAAQDGIELAGIHGQGAPQVCKVVEHLLDLMTAGAAREEDVYLLLRPLPVR